MLFGEFFTKFDSFHLFGLNKDRLKLLSHFALYIIKKIKLGNVGRACNFVLFMFDDDLLPRNVGNRRISRVFNGLTIFTLFKRVATRRLRSVWEDRLLVNDRSLGILLLLFHTTGTF